MQALLYEFATIPAVEGDDTMATQPERIAVLETTASIAKWVLGIFIPLVITWGTFITINVVAMKQSLADGGNTKLVSELKSPASPQQLQANLSTVVAQIQTARVNGKKPDTKKVTELSNVVSKVVENNPQTPEAWQAAAALITYRTEQPQQQNPKECGSETPQIELSNEVQYSEGLGYSNCTIVLDDAPDIVNSRLWIVEHQSMRNDPRSSQHFALVLNNVHVIYRGGSILPADIFIFTNCTFDFQMSVPPPAPAQSLSKLLLAANVQQRVTFVNPSPS
jgi:hypothetical protein